MAILVYLVKSCLHRRVSQGADARHRGAHPTTTGEETGAGDLRASPLRSHGSPVQERHREFYSSLLDSKIKIYFGGYFRNE